MHFGKFSIGLISLRGSFSGSISGNKQSGPIIGPEKPETCPLPGSLSASQAWPLGTGGLLPEAKGDQLSQESPPGCPGPRPPGHGIVPGTLLKDETWLDTVVHKFKFPGTFLCSYVHTWFIRWMVRVWNAPQSRMIFRVRAVFPNGGPLEIEV